MHLAAIMMAASQSVVKPRPKRELDSTAFFYPKVGLSYKKLRSSDNPPVDPERVRPPIVVPFVTADGGWEISRLSETDMIDAARGLAPPRGGALQEFQLIPGLFGSSGVFWNHAIDDESVALAERPVIGCYPCEAEKPGAGLFQLVATAGVTDSPPLLLKLTTPSLLATGSAISDISSIAFEVTGSAHVFFKAQRGDGRYAVFYNTLSSPRKIYRIVVTPDDDANGLEIYEIFTDRGDYKPGNPDKEPWGGRKEGSESGVKCEFTVTLTSARSSVRLVDIRRSAPVV